MKISIGLAGLLLLLSTWPLQAQSLPEHTQPLVAGDGQGIFLTVTDIHFDPFAIPLLVPKLDQNPVDEWAAILNQGAGDDFPGYGLDANFPLMMSALKAVAEQGLVYDYVIYTGDYLSHDFESDYNRYAGANPMGYDSFVVKTTQFVSIMLRSVLGDVPIFGTLGNNDAICGDYMIAPDSQLLKQLAVQWGELSGQPENFKDFEVGGFYKIAHPTVPGHDIIVLNNIFWSVKYQDACRPSGGNPGDAQMAWLKWQLFESQMRGRTATLVMHIPPGINAYSSSNGIGSCKSKITSFWQQKYTQGFLELIGDYKSVVKSSLAGHVHMDGLRVISDADGTPFFTTHITPAISPIFGNNPAFSYVLYDKTSAGLIDYVTVILSNLSAAGNGAPAQWQWEYIYSGAYEQSDMSPQSIANVASAIKTSPTIRALFMKFYAGETTAQSPINSSNWQAFSCAQTNITQADFYDCYCETNDH